MKERRSNDMENTLISSNISQIKDTIRSINPDAVLVAVTKNFGVAEINEAIKSGISHIGENRVQELLEKYDGIENRDAIKISIIGHLQTNKVKYIADKVDMIQSVDSYRLAETINKHCEKLGRVMDVLVQLNMGNEENKFGISPKDTAEFLYSISSLKHIKVRGLMGVLPKTDQKELTKNYFLQLYNIFLDIKHQNIDNIDMDILSMGMSGDYELALECGSNMVRVGSAIFGIRN